LSRSKNTHIVDYSRNAQKTQVAGDAGTNIKKRRENQKKGRVSTNGMKLDDQSCEEGRGEQDCTGGA